MSQEKISGLVVGVGSDPHPSLCELGRRCRGGKGGAGYEKGRRSEAKVGGEGREGKREGKEETCRPSLEALGTLRSDMKCQVTFHFSLPSWWSSYRHPDPTAPLLIWVRERGVVGGRRCS